MRARILATCLLILTVLFLPYWLYLPLLILGMALIPLYWEAIMVGFLIDTLYGPSGLPILTSVAFWSFLMLVASMPLRERLRWRL